MGPELAFTVLATVGETMLMAIQLANALLWTIACTPSGQTIPHRSRSAPHRLFQRKGINRTPAPEPAEKKKPLKGHPMGHLLVDYAEVYAKRGRGYVFVTINRPRDLAFAKLHSRATKVVTADFLCWVLSAITCRSAKVMNDNGMQFGNRLH